MPRPEFFREYRHNLAVQLSSSTDRQKRQQILVEAQGTLDYQLAKREKRAFQQGTDFSSKPIEEQKRYQQKTDEDLFCRYYMSNEGCLYKLFSTITEKTGTIVAVGSDQGLDLFVNSQAQYVLMVDISSTTSSFSRALLELGSVHKKIFGQYPTVEQYHNYFRNENVCHTIRLLGDNFQNEELDQIYKILTDDLSDTTEIQSLYYKFLRYKSQLTNDNGQIFSWNSSDENLKKVFEAYDQGRIFVIQRDLYSQGTTKTISEIIESRKSSLDVLYLSNSIDYLDDYKPVANTLKMPLDTKTIILLTDSELSSTKIRREEESSINTLTSYPFSSWHYMAISYDEYRKQITNKFESYSAFVKAIKSEVTSCNMEPGVTFVGV